MMDNQQQNLFADTKSLNNWEEHWEGMPEYDNVTQEKPFITATFKFRSIEDFNEFKNHIQKTLYNNERVFDGMQRKDVKSSWYPLNEKSSKYYYKDES